MVTKFNSHINPIKIALFVAFGIIALAVAYKAMSTQTNTKSNAYSPTDYTKCGPMVNGKQLCVSSSNPKITQTLKSTFQVITPAPAKSRYVPSSKRKK